jgi:hypothetical protein
MFFVKFDQNLLCYSLEVWNFLEEKIALTRFLLPCTSLLVDGLILVHDSNVASLGVLLAAHIVVISSFAAVSLYRSTRASHGSPIIFHQLSVEELEITVEEEESPLGILQGRTSR